MTRLLLINYEFPPLGGGAGNATANLARELAARGVEVRVLTAAFAGLSAREALDGFTVLRIPAGRRRLDRCTVPEMMAFLLGSLVAAAWMARRWRPDATIAFFGLPSGPAAWLLKALHGVPYVVSLRGGDVPGFVHEGIGLYHRLSAPLLAMLWRQAAAVVANSDGLAALARRFAPGLPVPVVPNGVDARVFHPAEPAPERPMVPASAVRLLFVGRLVHQKGLDVLLDAVAALPDPAAVVLTLAGDGPKRDELAARAAALGIAGQLRFAGWVGRAAMPELYRAAEVFVFPSRDEGMPNALLEAMASGLPVVATRISGNEELVVEGETGALVPADDVGALAAALQRLVADPGLRRVQGAAGRDRAVERYSWAAAAAAYCSLTGKN